MFSDQATEYASAVVDGRIVACENIKNACRRHLEDLEERHGKDLLWMPERANDVLEFFANCIMVDDPETQTKQTLSQLFDWQYFLIQSLHGWIVKEDKRTKRRRGTRRFRDVFLCSAKAGGKSALLAGHDLYLLARDHFIDLDDGTPHFIQSPYILVTASKKEQASALGLRVSADMVANSSFLQKGMETLGGNSPYAIVCPSSGGRLEAITTRAGSTGVSGLLLHAIHQEEFSDQSNRERWDALRAGLKMSSQPVTLIATNPAPQLYGLAYEHYRVASQAAAGSKEYDHVLGLIYESDSDEIPESVINVKRWYPVQKNWRKSNPSLDYGVPPHSYIHTQIKNAVTTRQKRECLRLNFGVWADEQNEFIGRDELKVCEVDELDEEEMRGMPLWLGLDLAATNDLTAIAMLWGSPDDCYLKVEAYTGLSNLRERTQESSGDMLSWSEEGWIKGNDDRTLDFSIVANRVLQLSQDHDLQGIAMDVHKRSDWDRILGDMGIKYRYENEAGWGSEDGILHAPHAQGHWNSKTGLTMDFSMTAFEEAVYAQKVQVEKNPVFEWAIESVRVKHNDKMERKITKKDAQNATRGKIDTLIAAVMAFGLMKRGLLEPDYGKHGPDPWSNENFDLAKLQRELYG